MNRGSPCLSSTAVMLKACFNEAPIHESGKYQDPFALRVDPAASMRPRFMNRGSEVLETEDYYEDGASMRPRFMNRGSTITVTTNREDVYASMRPRFMNRGSLVTIREGIVQKPGFNEAPIHESGK